MGVTDQLETLWRVDAVGSMVQNNYCHGENGLNSPIGLFDLDTIAYCRLPAWSVAST